MDRQTQQEVWRPIAEFKGEYEVSNFGRVRSMKQYYGQVGRIMPQTQQPSGRHGERRYFAVMCWYNKKHYCRKVHRLVAMAFIPNPDNLPEINHIDGDRSNNQVSNLEWCTRKYNCQHAWQTGLASPHRWTPDERRMISEKVKATLRAKRLKEETLRPSFI